MNGHFGSWQERWGFADELNDGDGNISIHQMHVFRLVNRFSIFWCNHRTDLTADEFDKKKCNEIKINNQSHISLSTKLIFMQHISLALKMTKLYSIEERKNNHKQNTHFKCLRIHLTTIYAWPFSEERVLAHPVTCLQLKYQINIQMK